jgi:23S rRNA pseudouridine1911/1915/1917 synthase
LWHIRQKLKENSDFSFMKGNECCFMAKPKVIELPTGATIPILYDDRVVLAIDKPAGWMLAPDDWDRTQRNLQRALVSSVNAGDFWAASRHIKFIRFIHRLDAETSGVVLFAKTPGALTSLSELFETRKVEKRYLAVVDGVPKEERWTCKLALSPEPGARGRMKVDPKTGKEAQTDFVVREVKGNRALIEAMPLTGRTHQIRVHLAAAGTPVLGDPLYGQKKVGESGALALRSIYIAYPDPFQRRRIQIRAPENGFLKQFGFSVPQAASDRTVTDKD